MKDEGVYTGYSHVLLLRRKAGVMSIVSCIHPQALDGSSHLYHAYSEHLSMATGFYTQLLGRLEEHYSLPVTSMDHSQLIGMAHTLGQVFFVFVFLFICCIFCLCAL